MNMKTRLLLRRVTVAAASVAMTLAITAGAAADTPLGTLTAGKALYWNGVQVDNARVDDPSLCGIQGPCFKYTVHVATPNAKVLRVALRTADDANGWEIELFGPDGMPAATASTYTLHGVAQDFDLEAWTYKPVTGTWTIEVVPENVKNGTFRMRAALDPVQNWPASNPMVTYVHVRSSRTARACGGARHVHSARPCAAHRAVITRAVPRTGVYDVPPDLAADAPWHLTFQQPTPMLVVESGNFLAMAGMHNTDASVAQQPLYDCLPEETVEQGGHRCLRFTSGFGSLGPGKFEVYGDTGASPLSLSGGPLYQDVYRSNGTFYSRHAGSFTFHQIHAHYHVLGIAQFQLFPVLAPGKLGPPQDVLKEGFCLGDIKMQNWYSFAQVDTGVPSSANCEPVQQPDGSWRFYEGIDAGWEDSYKWQTSGQFVNFASSPDGLYVLRVTVNPFHLLLEADSGHDTNNVAYTYFRVTGDHIQQIERGHGTDPWDPHKTVEDPVFGEG